jgi:spore coat polysaccharide biosynthesis protein SpsF
MKVIGTIEARMGSSRLPGKTLMAIWKGKSLLELVVDRFRMARNIDDVYVATTTEKGDDAIAQWCENNGVHYHRGSEEDVLDRVTETSIKAGAEAIVQMGADSAYLDYELIDHLVEVYKSGGYDYVCNDLELSFPLGIYAHVVRVSRLIELNLKSGLSKNEREDVVRYIFEHPAEYSIKNIVATPEFAFPELRFTIDYPEDMQLARQVMNRLGNRFTTSQLLELHRNEPELFERTKGLVQRSAPFIRNCANA